MSPDIFRQRPQGGRTWEITYLATHRTATVVTRSAKSYYARKGEVKALKLFSLSNPHFCIHEGTKELSAHIKALRSSVVTCLYKTCVSILWKNQVGLAEWQGAIENITIDLAPCFIFKSLWERYSHNFVSSAMNENLTTFSYIRIMSTSLISWLM